MRINPIASVFIAVLCYACQNVLIDKHLRGLSPFAMSGIMTGTCAIFSWIVIGVLYSRSIPVQFPTGSAIGWAAICGCIIFLAEIAFFNAYSTGNTSAVAITTIVTLIPVFVALIKWASGDGFPSGREILAIILAASAVILLATSK